MRRQQLAETALKQLPTPRNLRTFKSNSAAATSKSQAIQPKDRGSSPTVREGSTSSKANHMTTAKRRFGQNFLVDHNVVERIVDAVRPQAEETIVEIGPGRGALTSRLLEESGRLVAIEFDRDLVPPLREKFNNSSNLTLVEADALTVDFCALIQHAENGRVVANLPYNIPTAILHRLVEQRSSISNIPLILHPHVVHPTPA